MFETHVRAEAHHYLSVLDLNRSNVFHYPQVSPIAHTLHSQWHTHCTHSGPQGCYSLLEADWTILEAHDPQAAAAVRAACIQCELPEAYAVRRELIAFKKLMLHLGKVSPRCSARS